MPTSNGFLVPHPPTLFPPTEKQAFSGSANSFSSSSSSSASAGYFDRSSRASSSSAYMTDITPPITPTNSNFDVELKPSSVASSGPFPDERSLQEHLVAEHLSNSILKEIAPLGDDTSYRSDSEEDTGVFDAVANFRSRLLKSKQTANAQRALRIIESRDSQNPDEVDKDGTKEIVEAPPSQAGLSKLEGVEEEEEFVLPENWEHIFDQGTAAIWQEFKESVYGFNPEEPQPTNLPLPYANSSKSEVRSQEFPIFDIDSDVGHQLGKDNLPRGMVFERLPPTPKLPAKPIIRPVEPDWDISSLCLDTPSFESNSSFPMSLISFVAAQHATDVIPSSATMNNETSCLSLCDSPSFESSASISMSHLSPAQNDTSPVASSPAIFNESFTNGNAPFMPSPAAISRLMFATRPERRSFPVVLTGENLDMAAIIRLEIAASNYPGLQHLHANHNHGLNLAHGLQFPYTHSPLPPTDNNSYPFLYDPSFADATIPESLSYQQFMVIASNLYEESTPAQEERNEYQDPHGLALYNFLTRPGDFLQVNEAPKAPLPSKTSQPLVGLGLGSLTDGAIRSSASITRLEGEPVGVAGDANKLAVDVNHVEHSSPRVDARAAECNAEIEPKGVLSRLHSMQSRISMSIRARRDHKVVTAPIADHDVPHRQPSESGSSSSPTDKGYMADDESEIEPSGVLSGSQPPSHGHADSKGPANQYVTEPKLQASSASAEETFEAGAGEIPELEPHGAHVGCVSSLERSAQDSTSFSRPALLKSRKRLSHLFRSSRAVDSNAYATLNSPEPASTTLSVFTGQSSTEITSNLLGVPPQPSGYEPPLMNRVLSSPEHPSFLSRVSPLHHLTQSLRSQEYLARSRANLGLPSSYVSQNPDIGLLGLTSFVLTPRNDPRSPCSPFVEYFHPDSYVLGCQGILPPTDNAAQITPSSSTRRVGTLTPSLSGGLGESRSMELQNLGIGQPSGLLVASVSTMSTAEECQDLAQLASAPSPTVEDAESFVLCDSDVGALSPQSPGSPTRSRLLFKVPRFAKRRLYDIPEQPTPSPTVSAYRLRTRTPTPRAKLLPRPSSRSGKWSGLSVLKRLRSSSKLSWRASTSRDVAPIDDNSRTSSLGVPTAGKSANLLRRCLNKITRTTASTSSLSSSSATSSLPPSASVLSPAVIEHQDVPQPSFGVSRA